MSFCTSAMVAAIKAVRAPTIATEVIAIGDSENKTLERAIIYTPAVTMVAAWISADTGVGPSIASGNQTNSGIWALLPAAPIKKNKHAAVIAPAPISNSCARSKTSRYWTLPKVKKTVKMPRMKPRSPMRLTINAFLPASPAERLPM